MISERVKSGMANAAAKGKIVGRPSTCIDDIPVAVTRAYELLNNGKINKSECARMCDISRPSLDKYIKIIERKEVECEASFLIWICCLYMYLCDIILSIDDS